MTTKTNVKYRMSVMKEQRNFFHVQFDELKTAEAFGRSCVREENFNDEAGVWPPSQGYYFKIERVTTTVKIEFISSTSNTQKLKAQLAKKETDSAENNNKGIC